MADKDVRCSVCGKPNPDGDTICIHCQALIRGEAVEVHHQTRKEAERILHKEGSASISDKRTHH